MTLDSLPTSARQPSTTSGPRQSRTASMCCTAACRLSGSARRQPNHERILAVSAEQWHPASRHRDRYDYRVGGDGYHSALPCEVLPCSHLCADILARTVQCQRDHDHQGGGGHHLSARRDRGRQTADAATPVRPPLTLTPGRKFITPWRGKYFTRFLPPEVPVSNPNPIVTAAIPSLINALEAIQTFVANLGTDPMQIPAKLPGALQVLIGTMQLQGPALATSELGALTAEANAKIASWINTLKAQAPK